MSDDRINDDDQPTAAESKALIDRRDRLEHPMCADEPSRPEFLDFQPILYEMYAFLDQNKRLRLSPYQKVRVEYLFGWYYEAQKFLGEAADHYRRGAKVAQQIPDWALCAQLKHMESRACTVVDHDKQYYRAFEAARGAWEAWRKLPYRDLTEDVRFEFTLADTVGVTAIRVAEYQVAVDSMERAGVLLHRLQGRPDVNVKHYANDDLFLTWDWVTLYMGMGDYRQAFKRILQTRRKAKDLLDPINRARLQWFIAFIALGCAEQGPVKGFTRRRLLVVAGTAIDGAYEELRKCDDKGGNLLALLAEAKLLGLLRITGERTDKIKQAEVLAHALDDPVAMGQVNIAWGDEFVFQGNKRRAREFYRKVERDMTQVGFLELARVAQQRIARLSKPIRTKSSKEVTSSDLAESVRQTRKPTAPPPEIDLSRN
jgi:hypothetical protein